MSRTEAMLASHRFGFGPAPGEVDRIAGDPRGWLHAQLAAAPSVPAAMRDLPPGSENVLDWWDAVTRSVAELVRRIQGPYAALWQREAEARLAAAIAAEDPFRERLVWFWGNHFTVSGRKAVAIGMAGAHEREAVRPYVTGRFADMLHAAASHPGMLFYLDNYSSVGSQSRRGSYSARGLNENLAREILELHTLGVDGGYTQQDVREFAKMLTGWTFARAYDDRAGEFAFRNDFHEPGPKTLLGVTYEEAGEQEGRDALDRLARAPATARHVATKLARHFIADAPPPAAVARLEQVFLDSDGDLAAVSAALVDLPEAWTPTQVKVKSHQDYVVAVIRAVGGAADTGLLLDTLTSFGQQPFMAPSPAGWPDVASAWVDPDSAVRRARFAAYIAGDRAPGLEPIRVAADSIAGLADAASMAQIADAAAAGDNATALALVLASPGLQRR